MKAIILAVVLMLVALRVGAADGASASAYEELRTTSFFILGPVGEAGDTSETEEAFREILQQFDGASQFRRLLAEAAPAGQLYALLGLRTLDPAVFQAAAPRYAINLTPVRRQIGCVIRSYPLMDIFREIRDGKLY